MEKLFCSPQKQLIIKLATLCCLKKTSYHTFSLTFPLQIFSVQDLRRAVAEARQSHPADLYLVISDDAPEVPDGGWAANPDTAAPNPPQHASTQDGKQHSPPPPAPSDPPSQVSSRQSTAALEINTLLPSMEFFSPSTNSVHRHMLVCQRAVTISGLF